MNESDSLNFNVSLQNYNGPLEVLLDLAKSQKVDLAKISVTQLADQFIEFINKAKEVNLDLASEYLLMATWLTYLKSKLLLPQDEDDEFKAFEIAEKLKLQLKKLELIRLLSDQLLKKRILGKDIHMRGMSGGIKMSSKSSYHVTLYDLLKSYSNHVMRKNFLSISIPKLPVCTTEQAIKIIKKNLSNIKDWKEVFNLVPDNFKSSQDLKKSGVSGFFAASLELTREGLINIMQNEKFGKILIKAKK